MPLNHRGPESLGSGARCDHGNHPDEAQPKGSFQYLMEAARNTKLRRFQAWCAQLSMTEELCQVLGSTYRGCSSLRHVTWWLGTGLNSKALAWHI